MKLYAIKRLFTKRTKNKSKHRKKSAAKKNKWLKRLRWTFHISLMLMVVDIFYLSTIWPDWNAIKQGSLPKSQFILKYEQNRRINPSLARLQWRVVPYGRISRHLSRSVVVAEDGRFYTHRGFDLQALVEAFEHNMGSGRVTFGASTISQQTVKNLFLSSSRNPLRKWHELILTIGMEFELSKRQILWIYLNIAEFGEGIYGAEAAARHYWGISASQLSPQQAIELAASLPSPKKNNPRNRSRKFLQRVDKINHYFVQRYY
ncbi:MAG: monofunctional biosynthetic peptidoglycan transglycosylase [Gammaproteobacteria bacterium]|nr:monofunctional biosynthetic peptidoglycan transglycosylase [Gammaproteobacteria bacterium]